MNADRGHNLIWRHDLSEAERRDVTALKGTCDALEGLDLKIEIGASPADADDANTAALYYVDGRLVGYAAFDLHAGPTVEVCGMVDPDYRRRGIGRALLDALATEAPRREIKRMLLICEDASASGRAFVATVGALYRFSEHRLILDPAAFRAQPAPPHRLALRRAGREDVETLSAVLAASFDDPIEIARALITAGIDDPNQQHYLAYLDATIYATPIGVVKPIIMDRAAFIYAFGVVPAYRGRGYGREILSTVVAQLLDNGYAPIGIEVETENQNALGLYLSCGFRASVTSVIYGYYDVSLPAG